jgi:uncharacterized repeat protein (TIGR03943 family)
LLVWAAFFAWLWVSGEMSRYLGPRTYWVVPFGGVALGIAAILHLATLRTARPGDRLSAGDVGTALMLVAPLVAVAIVPSADLGSLAASRKSTTGVSPAAAGLSVEGAEPVENPSFRDVANAEQSEAYSQAIAVGEGTEVDLVGFVDEGAGPEGTFELTRFYVSCCAADAIPYSVAVDPPEGATEPDPDDWARASGVLERRGDRLVLAATSLEPADEPDEPYLY